jgi:nickel/cobalt transporter (NiCoT) family protein
MAAQLKPDHTGRRSRIHDIRHGLTGPEWTRVASMTAFILALHVVGWFTLLVLIAPGHYSIGTKTFGVGIGVTAYTLGMRHAFDADHISAIDNTTRKLMADKKRPLSVGFWFSLGHSSVVFVLIILLTLGVKALVGPVKTGTSSFHVITNVVGTSVSGTFLYLIAVLNMVILIGVLKVFRDMRRGVYDHATLEAHLNNRGFMNRIFGRLMRSITKPGQMYPVGVLFGLGFDTATEVALLVVAGTGAASGLPWYAILCLPVLFAAGMSLLDTIDGTFMNFAYEWAFSNPVRKVYYNITITGLSVAVALLIGTVEFLALMVQELHLGGPFWTWVGGLNINTMGFVIVGLFVGTWLAALIIWRAMNIEQRWNAGMQNISAPVQSLIQDTNGHPQEAAADTGDA